MDNSMDGAKPVAPNVVNTYGESKGREKKGSALTVVLGAAALVFAGLATYFGIEYFKPKPNGTEQSGGSETMVELSMADDYKSVEKLVEKVTTSIEGHVTNMGVDDGLAFKPDGLNTYVPMRINIVSKISNSNSSEQNVTLIKSKLEEAGFKSIGILPFKGSAGTEIFGYSGPDDIVCGVYGNDYDSFDYAILGCGKTDWYWLTDEEYQLISELETAYYDRVGEYPTLVVASGITIEDSSVEPYQTLMANLGGGVGIFYRVSPTDKWQFFVLTQDAPDCDAYDTDDLKKAFAGTICYDYDTMAQSKVQP